MGMTLGQQRRVLRWTLLPLVVVIGLGGAALLRHTPYWPLPPAFALPALAYLGRVRRWLNRVAAHRAFRRLAGLVVDQHLAAARGVLAELREAYAGSRKGLELLRLYEANILSLERRYSDARALLDSVDRSLLSSAMRPWLLNNLAWSLVQLGEGQRAVEAARQSMSSSDDAGDRPASVEDVRAYQLGTLGAALVVDDKPDEGVALLEQALTRGGRPRAQAARAFYLGEGLAALGRVDEARASWQRAVDLAADEEYAERARSRLETCRGMCHRAARAD